MQFNNVQYVFKCCKYIDPKERNVICIHGKRKIRKKSSYIPRVCMHVFLMKSVTIMFIFAKR